MGRFRKKGKITESDKRDYRHLNYFEAGLIDSLEIIELIVEIEGEYGIRFSQENFQDRRFSTIGGLEEIILELINGK